MSQSFTKLFSSITESTVWVEPYPTRIAWVAMLANTDELGRIYASVPGLAKLAGITLPEVEAALACFLGPDRWSRTKEHDGRRIKEIDGGWQLLNHGKYRAMMSAEKRREYQREWDREHRPERYRKPASDTKSDTLRQNPTNPIQAEAEAEADKNQTLAQPPVDNLDSVDNPTGAPTALGGVNAPRAKARADFIAANAERLNLHPRPGESHKDFAQRVQRAATE